MDGVALWRVPQVGRPKNSIGSPLSKTRPLDGRLDPGRFLSRVVLPEPLSPIRAVNSPDLTCERGRRQDRRSLYLDRGTDRLEPHAASLINDG